MQNDAGRASQKKPGRRRNAYTRNGCTTCKIRHLKCDEQKPSCNRCLSTGRKCDGYATSPSQQTSAQDIESLDKSNRSSASGQHESMLMPVSDSEKALTIRPMHSIMGIPGTEQERRSWHHFRYHTAPILAGYFDFDFWNRLLLQMSHSEPILRHAMIAVSVVHEWAAKVGNLPFDALDWQKERDHRFALEHYNSAISLLVLQSKPSGPPLDITLMVCILFVCIEFLQHNKENAITHVKNGLRILSSLESEDPNLSVTPWAPGSRVVDNRIVQMFVRLATQCKFLGLEHKFPKLKSHSHGTERSPGLGPPTFSSLMAAREAMDHFMEESLRFLLQVEPFRDCPLPDASLTAAQLDLLKELDWWLFAFESLVQTSEQTMASQELEATKMLRIHHRISKIWLSTCLSLETAHDAYLSDFRAVVTLAESMVKTSMDYRTFSFEMGADPPLYFVALKCRHPVLRRQAIKILNSRHRQEAHWHSHQMASIASRIVAIEEAGIDLAHHEFGPGMISDANRIRDMFVAPTPLYNPRRSLVTFKTKPDGPSGEWFEWQEDIPWGEKGDKL